MTTRQKKQAIIIGIFVTVFILFTAFIVSRITPDPTCFDKKQNQGEAGIDCGGPCGACITDPIGKDLIITDSNVLYGGEGKYDVVARVQNPNALFGAEKFYYTFEIKNAAGEVLATRSGESFILPNEKKYLIEVGFESTEAPSQISTTVEKVDWIKFADFDSPQILVKNQRAGFVEGGPEYARAFGLVVNESPYDFQSVLINVVLLDERGIPIAVNTTEQNAMNSGMQREFTLNFPERFSGIITSTVMEAEANIFDSLNFMQKYLPSSRSQDFSVE